MELSHIFGLLLSAIAAVVFAFMDRLIFAAGWRIMHGLGVAIRSACLGIMVYATVAFQPAELHVWLAIATALSYMGMFGLVFRPTFNFFRSHDYEFMGMTAWYDKQWRRYFPSNPGRAATLFEFGMLFVGILIYLLKL